MTEVPYDPAAHYDRVTAAWMLMLGDELHYGLFETGDEDLAAATSALTRLMADAARVERGAHVLDVGCGTGTPALYLARQRGASVTGITTSPIGVEIARQRAVASGLDQRATFEVRDGMDNGFPDSTFDRVWVLESSHLMRERDRLFAECARVLRPGGRLALCDVVLRRPMPFEEVRRLRAPLALLRDVFGDARMEPMDRYADLAAEHGLVVDRRVDLTAAARPTIGRWADNARRNRTEVTRLLGDHGVARFLEACAVLEGLWDDGTLGYGLLAAEKQH